LAPGQNNNPRPGLIHTIRHWLRENLPTRGQFRHLAKVLSLRERYIFLASLTVGIFAVLSMPVASYYHFTRPIPAQGGTYTEGMIGTPQYLNPLLLQDSDVDRDVSRLLFDGLMKQTASGTLDFALAKNYTVSDDGLEYRFQLRDNLHWHDGAPITADDVVFTIQAAQNPDYLSAQQIVWRGVEVSKIDDTTVSFRLKNRYAQFLNNATIGILPKHVWQSVKPSNFRLSTLNVQPIGSGPYRFKSLQRTEGAISSLTLSAFRDYYFGRPFIDEMNFQFFQTTDYSKSQEKAISALNGGDIDAINYVPTQLLSELREGGITQVNLKLPRYYAVFFNQSKSAALSDKNVRQALNFATDREIFISKILSGRGEVVTSPLLPGIINVKQPTKVYSYDVDAAGRLLDQAGWRQGEDGLRYKESPAKKLSDKDTSDASQAQILSIELTTRDTPELLAAANLLKDQWRKVGVEVLVTALPASEISQNTIKNRDYQALLYGEVLALNPDPFSFWHSSQKREPGLNLSLYDSPDADKLLEDSRQNMDFGQRLQNYGRLQDIILADAPAVLLYSPDYVFVHSGRLKGVDLSVVGVPADRYNSVGTWYVQTKRVHK